MRVKSAKFVTSCSRPEDVSDKYFPQVCVAGRSNCGKSSLLNLLMGARLCKTSSTPGRTRLINVFETSVASDAYKGDKFYFIDLPGYGFSSASRSEAEEWNVRTERYFDTCKKHIAQALCLMDIRREPSDLDKMLINYFRDMEVPFTVVLTKADKLKKSRLRESEMKIASALGLALGNLIVTSALDNTGRDAVLDRLESVLCAFGAE